MKFTDPQKLSQVVETIKTDPGNIARGNNRARINRLMNGEAPFTDQELLDMNGQANFNALEGTNIIHNARTQCNNAYLKPGIYFTATTDAGPPHLNMQWGNAFTKRINRILKKNLAYTELLRATHAQMIMHGIGPVNWTSTTSWLPKNIELDSLLIPSKTLVSMENLSFFAIAREYNYSEFFRMAKASGSKKAGWNQDLVNKILKSLAKDTFKTETNDLWQNPERLSQNIQENSGYFGSDKINTVDCWDCYFENDEGNGWNRRIILQTRVEEQKGDEFLFNPGNRKYADNHRQLIHFQFADGSNVGPFLYHTVRSLGFLLYQVCHIQNRLRCKFTDAVFDSMMMLFRNTPGSDREYKQLWEQIHMGFLPDNIGYVPANERFQVNAPLVVAALQQNRQLMKENSASFTHDMDTGTIKEKTATETIAEVNTASALVGAMLNLSFTYQTPQYEEIVRRFCLKDSPDPDVKEFQQGLVNEDHIPREMLDPKKWHIEPERTVGNGNKTLQLAQSRNLMEARNLYDPDAQREILHLWTEANSDDAGWADHLVPLRPKELSDAAHDANLAIGTLMMGLPVMIKRDLNHIDYVETLLKLMGLIVQQIEQSGGMTTQDKIVGLSNTAQHIQQHIALIAQDPNEKQRVKQYMDALGQIMNMVKGYTQRLQEQMQQAAQAGPAITPEAQAKIASAVTVAQTQAKIKEAAAAQRQTHKELDFQATQHRKDMQATAEAQATIARTQADIAAKDLTTEADILRKPKETETTK